MKEKRNKENKEKRKTEIDRKCVYGYMTTPLQYEYDYTITISRVPSQNGVSQA